MTEEWDVVVIGGGIVGLAHAWMAAERGLRVKLVERTHVAQGASVRNFGMVWPIGQPAGELYALALRSRERWRSLGASGVVEIEECGSIHAAHHADEWAVLEEFRDLGEHEVSLLSAQATLAKNPLINPHGLQGGMYSPSELRVNPRVASARLAAWLKESLRVDVSFDTQAIAVEDKTVCASDGRRWTAPRIVICSGHDLQTLFPNVLLQSGLRLCKLQMLKAHQAHGMKALPHIASGLTLRHYRSFEACPSLAQVRQRVTSDSPELDRYGIHVMASIFNQGDILLGDSHEYDGEISPFDKPEIDALILRELQKVICLNDWTIGERWSGIYAKHAEKPVYEHEPYAGVHVFVGTGGAGMSMSFGLAERAWKRWMGESE